MMHQEGNFASQHGYVIYHQSWHPPEAPRATILLVHGMAEHSGRYANLAAFLTQRGYAICALDLPGHGKSGGQAGHIRRFNDYLAAVAEYVELLQRRDPAQTLYLLGHSMGGLISATFLLERQQAFAGAVLSGPAVQPPMKPPRLQMLLTRLLSMLAPTLGVFQLSADGVSRDSEVVRRYTEDPLNYHGKMSARCVAEMFAAMQKLAATAADIELPLLIMHGGEDSIAAPDGSRYLHQACRAQDKTLKVYEGLFHEIFNEPEKEQIYQELADWLDARSTAPR